LAYIMVGSGRLATLLKWLVHVPESFPADLEAAEKSGDFRGFYRRYYYKGQLAAEAFRQLMHWDPNGRADAAYEFYIWLSQGRAGEGKSETSLRNFPIARTTMVATGCVTAGRTASGKVYDRFAAAMVRDRVSYTKARETGQQVMEAMVAMWHPADPDWGPGVQLIQHIQKLSRHPLRFRQAKHPTQAALDRGQAFFRDFTNRLATLLVADGDPGLADEMTRFFEETWGDGSPFMAGAPRPPAPRERRTKLIRYMRYATPEEQQRSKATNVEAASS
jgi:hypothetical protein